MFNVPLVSILGFVTMLLYNIIFMLIATLIIATITLTERKVLALVQRRVGPNFVGYKGRLQYLADALKLFLKNVAVPKETNKFWFIFMPAVACAICYSFWINSVWGPSLSIFDIEYNIVYASLLSVLFGLCIILTGYFSKNKYAVLASVRAGVLMLNLEIFLGLLLLNVVVFGESFSFGIYVTYQEAVWFLIVFFNFIGAILLVFLLEVNRAPFDLAEAESELVAGYSTEYGGFFFALFYLGEYFHLFFFSLVLSTLFLGGWELPLFTFMQVSFLYYF
jgi:NADH-quinone oxidoreductase subunit H